MAGALTAKTVGMTGNTVAVSQLITGPTGSPLAGVGARAGQVLVTNRTGVEVWMTLDGTVPVVAAAGTYLLPASIGVQIVMDLPEIPDFDDAAVQGAITLQAIGASAWSVWVEVI